MYYAEIKTEKPFGKVVEDYINKLECENAVLADKLDDAERLIKELQKRLVEAV
jgi:hypothetical protein